MSGISLPHARALVSACDRLPLGPFVDTFMPAERGNYQGELIARLQLAGTGVTGPNLRKNLQAQSGSTNPPPAGGLLNRLPLDRLLKPKTNPPPAK